LLAPAAGAARRGDPGESQPRASRGGAAPPPEARLGGDGSWPTPAARKRGAGGPPKKKDGGEGKDVPPEKKVETAPKAGGPPPLDATIDAMTGKITVHPKKPAQQGLVMAKVGAVTALARVRVVPQIPYQQDVTH